MKQKVKHDASIVIWGCFSWNGVGNFHCLDCIMNSKDHMVPSGTRLFDGKFIMQQDNDPKHTNILEKKK